MMENSERLAILETKMEYVEGQVEKLDNVELLLTQTHTMLKPLAESKLPERVADLESTRRFAKILAVPVLGTFLGACGRMLGIY
jgi:hypothetical protein